jgi:hypothetical protein
MFHYVLPECGDAVYIYSICLKQSTGLPNLGLVWRKCGGMFQSTFKELYFLKVGVVITPA